MLDYLDDLDSDFSVFHRADFRAMPAPRMFALAYRLPAYGGVMASRVAEMQREQEPEPDDGTVPSDPHTLTTHPGLSGLIEIG